MSAPHKYWRVYDEALAALATRDLAERCAAAGYAWREAGIEISFLDRQYLLCRAGSSFALRGPADEVATENAGSRSAEQQEEHLRDRILIFHYLGRASGASVSGTMVGFDQLTGARFYGSTFRGRVELPLVRSFASRPALLVETAEKLGGSRARDGDCSVLLHPFPRVPFTFILWQGDDEVPANGKVLWDALAEDYLSAEDLTVLGETLVRKLKAWAARLPSQV